MSDRKKQYGPEIVEGYTIRAFLYGGPNEWTWHVTSQPVQGMMTKPHDYWVSKGKFTLMDIALMQNGAVATSPTGTPANVAPAEKAAIVKALAQWELAQS